MGYKRCVFRVKNGFGVTLGVTIGVTMKNEMCNEG
nr:MAG TPA: hypothetical protein [Caudoviricetes sp.]